MCYHTQLDARSAELVNRNLRRIFLGENFSDLQLLNKPPPRPGRRQSADDWVLLKPFWLPAGQLVSPSVSRTKIQDQQQHCISLI